jgi:L-seryl-tRNA(Ser) seleniumtransferase
VTFSGDKLLGGPQAGIVAGRRDLVAMVAKNPMKRAVRIDKIRLAALEAVLKLYRDPDRLALSLPTLRYFVRPRSEIESIARRLLPQISAAAGDRYVVSVVACASQIGSGSLPTEVLPSSGIAIVSASKKGAGTRLEALSSAFRQLPIPVIGYINDGALTFDLRCLDDEPAFAAQLARLQAGGEATDVD